MEKYRKKVCLPQQLTRYKNVRRLQPASFYKAFILLKKNKKMFVCGKKKTKRFPDGTLR